MLTWLVKIKVDKSWVADGFDLTKERARDMISDTLPYAYGYEYDAVIVKAPPKAIIRKIRGG